MKHIVAILFLSLSFCTFAFAQDFFEEEADSVLWFYDTKPTMTIAFVSTPGVCPYGGAVWIHHKKHKFSTYVEAKGAYEKDSYVAVNDFYKSSYREISGSKLAFKTGFGLGSTIKENYLWYFNVGIQYSQIQVPSQAINDQLPGYKPDAESPFGIHWGGGVAAVFAERFHIQVGLDLETVNLTGGLGFVF